MARYGDLNYPRLAKGGFLLGVALFLLGGLGGVLVSALVGTVSSWENALFFDLEALGIAIGLLSPLVFAILLPLTE